MAILHDFGELAVLVTGAGRGLGRSVAEKLASCGATVAVVDVDTASCEAVAAGIRGGGGRAFAYAIDVADCAAFADTARRFAAERGRIDAVVNNAMLLRYEPIENVTDEVLERMLGVGIKGAVWGAQALLRHLDAERGGAIVNMASPVAERGYPNTAVYSLVKGALVTLTRTLAAELGPRRVRVNAVAPGVVVTELHTVTSAVADYPAFLERGKATHPIGRVGRVEEVAALILFLLSDEAGWITGSSMSIDGGRALASAR